MIPSLLEQEVLWLLQNYSCVSRRLGRYASKEERERERGHDDDVDNDLDCASSSSFLFFLPFLRWSVGRVHY